MHGRVRTGGGARHVGQGDPATGTPTQKGLAQKDLGGCCHVKIELHLLLFVCLGCARAGVAGIEQHLVLVIGCVGRPERGVIKNPKLPPYVLHVNFHLLHGAVEDTFSLFHRKGDFFRHEVAIIDWNPGSRMAKERERETESASAISKVVYFFFFF